MKSMFFSNLYPRFSKKDIYKCPFFKKGLRELKFSYIITLSASAIHFSRGYLYALIYFLFYYRFRALWCGYMFAGLFAKDGAKLGEPLFNKTRMDVFRGCLEYSPPSKFNLCPKNGGSCFDPFFSFLYPLFGGSFVFYGNYLILNLLSTFKYIIYQTYLKKP
jgi:hypothetical protein